MLKYKHNTFNRKIKVYTKAFYKNKWYVKRNKLLDENLTLPYLCTFTPFRGTMLQHVKQMPIIMYSESSASGISAHTCIYVYVYTLKIFSTLRVQKKNR